MTIVIIVISSNYYFSNNKHACPLSAPKLGSEHARENHLVVGNTYAKKFVQATNCGSFRNSKFKKKVWDFEMGVLFDFIII